MFRKILSLGFLQPNPVRPCQLSTRIFWVDMFTGNPEKKRKGAGCLGLPMACSVQIPSPQAPLPGPSLAPISPPLAIQELGLTGCFESTEGTFRSKGNRFDLDKRLTFWILKSHSTCGCGSKLNHQGTAAFTPCFLLQGFYFGVTLFLTHSPVCL